MTCRIQALPPAYVAQTKEEARAILNDPASTYSQRKLAWEFLRNEHKSRTGPKCPRCGEVRDSVEAPIPCRDPDCPKMEAV